MMKDTIDKLNSEFSEFPTMRADSLPSSKEIEEASKEVGVPFAPDYHEFLSHFGGAMVGAYPIYGLRSVPVMGSHRWSVVEVTRQFRDDKVPGCDSWVVISEDQAGNPIGMDSEGSIWIHDHDFGGISPLAKSFEEYIRTNCLNLP
jgi:hypothetical protein